MIEQCFALKHNGDVSKHFHNMHRILDRDDVIVLYSAVGSRVDELRKKTHWLAHYAAYKVFPKNENYNFVIVEKENGNEYYCNLASPPKITADAVSYIDYDIDVILTPAGEIEIHDIEQFQERTISYSYPADLVDLILQTQTKIEADLVARSGYFSDAFYREIALLNDANNSRIITA